MGGRSRSRSRERQRSRYRSRSRSGSRDGKEQRRRSSSKDRALQRGTQAPRERSTADDKKTARLQKLAAWKQQRVDTASNGGSAASASQAWTPWEAHPAKFGSYPNPAPPWVAASLLDSAVPTQHQTTAEVEDDVDPLDAFMASEINPELAARQEEERRVREAERLQRAKRLAEGTPVKPVEPVHDSDSEDEPDVEINVPAHKVKLIIGPGGEKIKWIQRKSKARVQVKKDEAELNKAFGAGPTLQGVPKGPQAAGDGQIKLVTIMIFGDPGQCEAAQALIQEAIDNKEQKQKQRQKEYEKKRDVKLRDRQLYHLRHTRDYEALGVPLGTPKPELKKAYRQLAKLWHPDKHPENKEQAKIKFQEIQRAYDSLMSTDEDQRIEALEARR